MCGGRGASGRSLPVYVCWGGVSHAGVEHVRRESAVCSCYPFCMAAQISGSQTSAPVLYSASQWGSKVYMVKGDCNLQSTSDSLDGSLFVTLNIDWAAVSSTQTPTSGSHQFVSGSRIVCTDNLLVTSIINRIVHPDQLTRHPLQRFCERLMLPL